MIPDIKPTILARNVEIFTVEELERRKHRFRRAAKEYYQAEREFRCIHGFCNSYDSETNRKRKREVENGALDVPFKSTLRRCRPRRSGTDVSQRSPKTGLETEFAKCLLESHFEVLEKAIQDYLFSIKGLLRPIRRTWRQPPQDPLHPPRLQRDRSSSDPIGVPPHRLPSGTAVEGVLLRLPQLLPLTLPLPLPLPLDKNQLGECLQSRMLRHHSEALEEKHMAMASAMVAVRETRVTEELAKKIHCGVDSIQVALKQISALIEANRDNTFYYYHYDCKGIGWEEVADKEAKTPWNRTVVEARKLDGYYRWFRANNGVLLTSTNGGSNANTRDIHNEQEARDDGNCRAKKLRREILG